MTMFKKDIKSRKEEEFFRMVLLSYQMVNRKNKRMTALDPVALYKEVSEVQNVPFYRYQDWIEHKGKQVLFDGMFKQHQKTLSKQLSSRMNSDNE